jgi:hypothetical protein
VLQMLNLSAQPLLIYAKLVEIAPRFHDQLA